MVPPWHFRLPPLAKGLVLLLGGLGCCATSETEAPPRPLLRGAALRNGDGAGEDVPRHILVFDAGSSGTRIHVFNIYPANGGERVPRIDLTVRENQTLKVKPGLSHFARSGDLDGVELTMTKLFAFANRFVPLDQRAATAAVLKATAGLRVVEASKSDAILQRVRTAFSKSGYSFCSEWAGIIPGIEEGGFAWVAANYLEGTFNAPARSETKSIGVIEMGGGSTQVTFQADPRATLAESDRYVFVTALGEEFVVYAHSYLGYGQDYAQTRMRDLLPTSALDPCYPPGYQRPGKSPFPIKGGGDSDSCRAMIREQLLQQNGAPGAYIGETPLRGRFVATENFVHVRRDAAFAVPGNSTALAAEAREACTRQFKPSREEVALLETGKADAGHPRACFALSYQAAFLQQLKGFSASGVTVRSSQQIASSDIDWAVGAALVHCLRQPRCYVDAAASKDNVEEVKVPAEDWAEQQRALLEEADGGDSSTIVMAAIGVAFAVVTYGVRRVFCRHAHKS